MPPPTPSDDDAAMLRGRAEQEGRPMEEIGREAVRPHTEVAGRRELLESVLESELPRYADALDRLGR